MKTTKILTVVALVLIPVLAGAQGMHLRLPSAEALEKLGLTAEQKEQLKGIQSTLNDQVKELSEKCQKQGQQVKESLRESTPNKKAVGKAAKQFGEQRAKITALRAESLAEALAILTPEQREKVHEWTKNRPRAQRGNSGRRAFGDKEGFSPEASKRFQQVQRFRAGGSRPGGRDVPPEVREKMKNFFEGRDRQPGAPRIREFQRFRQNWAPDGERGKERAGQRLRERARKQECPLDEQPKED